MKVGITGAGGYVGAGLSASLIESGYQVTLVDNNYNSQVKKIHDERITWADVRNREKMERIFRECDIIIHLAALSGVVDCNLHPDMAYEVNIVGTGNIAWVCRKYGIDLIFPSSMAVIGNPQIIPIRADHPRDPLNLYGFTKWMGEVIVERFAKGGFNALVFMKSNLYGEYELDGKDITKNTVINIFTERARNGENLTVHKPGTQARDFVHVLDVIDAYTLAVKDFPEGFNIVPVAGGECLSVLDIAELVKKFSEREVKIELVDNPRGDETHTENFEVDTTEAERLIGFKARRSVEDEIKRLLGCRR